MTITCLKKNQQHKIFVKLLGKKIKFASPFIVQIDVIERLPNMS